METDKAHGYPAVRVVTERAADRFFDYAVPDEYALDVRVGQRVRVPFGSSVLNAYIVELLDEIPFDENKKGIEPDLFGYADQRRKLKKIIKIEDPIPFLTKPLIALTRWIANYTCSPFESVLCCALPAVVRHNEVRTKELLFVTPCNGDFQLTARQRELLTEIKRVDGGWLHFLTKEFSCSTAILKTLAAKGALIIEKRAMRRDPLKGRKILPSKPLPLMQEQEAALRQICALLDSKEKTKPLLLFGVTGSGKTEVYLQAIAHALEQGRGAIILVPEIALTPQTVQRFAARFGNRIAVLHSALGDGERYDEWNRIRKGEADVVVGPRSAVFAPVQNLGLLIVDEEHEPSYKQDEAPRYHARDVAVVRGQLESCVVVLGSATPAMETWCNVKLGKYHIAKMAKRVANRPMPTVQIVDMRLETLRAGHAQLFSEPLLEAIRLRLERGEQTILFLNRRGYSRSLLCPKCGYVATCEACDIPYTYHQTDSCLRCHICGDWKHLPDVCPSCGDPALRYVGIGTQRAETALAKCFPQARILRMDADVTSRKNSHDEILSIFKSGQADILIGTQMIAKGLDFPNVTLVGVLAADSSLHVPDFRAAERTYQLLAQVSGRAGRAELPGEVYIQSYSPDHPAIQAAASDRGFEPFAERELCDRKEGAYPPFTHLLCLTFTGKIEHQTKFTAEAVSKCISGWIQDYPHLILSEACPAPMPKAKGLYRFQILLRAPLAKTIHACLQRLFQEYQCSKEVKLAIDMDALDIG